MSVGTRLELEDFCDESDVVRKELMEEVDIGDLSKRSLFRMGGFCMRVPQSLPLPLYAIGDESCSANSVAVIQSKQHGQE